MFKGICILNIRFCQNALQRNHTSFLLLVMQECTCFSYTSLTLGITHFVHSCQSDKIHFLALIYCSKTHHHTHLLFQFLWVRSTGMAYIGPLLRVYLLLFNNTSAFVYWPFISFSGNFLFHFLCSFFY